MRNVTYNFLFSNSLLPQTRAILSRADTEGITKPSMTTVKAMNKLIKKMIVTGIWDRLDYFANASYNDVNMKSFATINWKRPNDYPLSVYGADTLYNANGWKGVGTANSEINTHLTSAYSGRISTNTNVHYMSVVNDVSEVTAIADSLISSGGSNTVDVFFAFNTNVQRIASSGANNNLNSNADLSGTGLKVMSRYTSNDVRLINKTVVLDRTSVGGELPPLNVLILRNSVTRYSKLGLSCFSIGQSLHDGKDLLFRDMYNQYLIEIGLTAIA